ncbi:hypothetical protein [Chromatium okenii]|uniref:hypothetical protein n=1 Tax=Chromatium okenii TaxID=61644 RepID=UPI0018D56ADD|nr:hypothetical protein [Chromatium okenii]
MRYTNALALLKPGGKLGVVDFYVSEAQPAAGLVAPRAALTRWWWPRWFGHDGVHLHAQLNTLRQLLPITN